MSPSEPIAGTRVLPLPATGAPPAPRVPVPERWLLRNGLRVVAVPRRALPEVAVRLVVPAGASADPSGRFGTASMVTALLTEGTLNLSAEALNERLDALGASVSVQVAHDFVDIDLFLLSETLDEGLRLLADLVSRPAFPPEETERVRAETLDALEARNDEPANVADDRLAEELFGPDHPYGRLTFGTPEGVRAIDRELLASFHTRHYRPEGSVLLIAGDFDRRALGARLEEEFGGWTGRVPALDYPPPPRAPHSPGQRIDLPRPDAAQGEIRLGGLGMPRSSPDWIVGAVANYLLGGSTITGRLGANLREDKGWTYGIRSAFAGAVQAGGWVVEVAVDAEVIDAALDEIVGELDRFMAERVSDEELRRAKDALILSLPRAFETPGRIIGRLSTLEVFGLEPDYWERFPERVEAVDAAEVLRVARTYFDPRALVRVVAGPG